MARILFLEDEKNLAFIAKKFLEKEGYEVEWVQNGLDGLRAIEAGPAFDLHICDLSMPQMDGFAFMEELDKMENPTKTLVASAYLSTSKYVEQCSKFKTFCGYINKPYRRNDLVGMVVEKIGLP